MSESPQPLVVEELVVMMIDQLAAVAWQKMGLQPDMLSGTVDKNLPAAKIAVDAVAALVPLVENQLEESDRREMHNLVRNLRLNFVEKSKEDDE
jgi:hypothetical protein